MRKVRHRHCPESFARAANYLCRARSNVRRRESFALNKKGSQTTALFIIENFQKKLIS